MRRYFFILLLLPLLWQATGCTYLEHFPNPAVAPVDTVPTKISFDATAATIFPEHWLVGPINAKCSKLEKGEETRSTNCLVSAMEKYPSAMLNKNLKNVYVLRSLNFYSVGFGATYYEKNLYIANSGTRDGYTNRFIEQSFHHEFSSILFYAFYDKFDKKAWLGCNPDGFEYHDEATGGVQSLKDNLDGTYFSERYNNQGFLDQYSQSSLENDVNQLAQQLFCPDPGFWDVVEKHPKVKCKVDKLIAFYGKIDPAFTTAYFKKFASAY